MFWDLSNSCLLRISIWKSYHYLFQFKCSWLKSQSLHTRGPGHLANVSFLLQPAMVSRSIYLLVLCQFDFALLSRPSKSMIHFVRGASFDKKDSKEIWQKVIFVPLPGLWCKLIISSQTRPFCEPSLRLDLCNPDCSTMHWTPAA